MPLVADQADVFDTVGYVTMPVVLLLLLLLLLLPRSKCA
uniref:Uncharacterized protein n=1 Tax=Nonomuraea gerenzanensis TaxID=93944 RepID=A0A1M4EG65_9ACTN|nr:hypothetical protein BN4615_P7059 [Nonomuraea gerenzanensis]